MTDLMRKLYALLTFLFVLSSIGAYATHNRAGEISFVRLGPTTYKAIVITYTKSDSPADRCRIELNWGDGQIDTLNRINGQPISGCPKGGEIIAPFIKKNVYEGVHTYSGGGVFTLWVSDPNRNAGIINIQNSVNVPFYIETKLVISPFLGVNNSVVLLNPPIDNACVGKVFIHNPGAFDPDLQDSIAYELVACRGDNGQVIADYFVPAGVTLDPVTGDFVWNAPTVIGEFNFAILIKEYRNGQLIGFITRDMQVTVGNCNNDPPIVVARDTCVEANTTLSFSVTAFDPNPGDEVTLTSTGGPYMLTDSPAEFIEPSTPAPSVTGMFSWDVKCSHVKVQPYTVTFKAEDDRDPEKLANLVTIRIRVVAPAPDNLTATAIGNTIRLDWIPTVCSNAVGYKIYRRSGATGFIPDNCETGVPASLGYSLIATLEGSSVASYTDNNGGNGLIHGMEYCYIIHAFFADGAESYASNETCTELKKDIPVITHVSVIETSPTAGKDTVIWSKPTEMDSSLTGPFRYLVYRSPDKDGINFSLIDSLDGLNDTIYYDQTANLNTVGQHNSYRIDLYSLSPTRTKVGSTQSASSIFLDLDPSDNQLTLSWSFNVPWANKKYYIYKKDDAGVFFLLDSTTSTTYTDGELVNGKEYCYFVKGYGEYSATGFLKPLINNSQIACGRPEDKTAPCAPKLNVKPSCDLVQNYLTWNNPNLTCADDVMRYRIYYKTTDDTSQQFALLAEVEGSNDTAYTFIGNNSIAGCYVITALDTFNNESAQSNIVCVDNCPVYELPNVFTPNGDGLYDLFIPLPYKFVESIDIKIYNRWGNLVFQTTDPNINWDGRNQDTKKPCSDGVYYYTCQVNEIRLSGIQPRMLNGFVHLYNTKPPQAQ